ncbi:TTC28 [Symbiodinium sp. CCMP2592]|nr:TTC28 [Symbiodinium sp. CCMP2592]
MTVGISRGYEPGRVLLILPTTDIGVKHAALAEDASLQADLQEASRLLAEAEASLSRGRIEDSQSVAKKALEQFRACKSAQGVADATRVAMCALAEFESRKEALALGQEHLKDVRAAGNKEQEAMALQSLAEVATFRCRGELRDSALAWADEAVTLQRELGNKKLEGFALLAAASACTQKSVKAHQRKHYLRAIKSLKAAIQLFTECPEEDVVGRSGEARALHGLASATGRLEDFRKSVSHAREAAAMFQQLGLRKEEGLELEFLARLQLQLGHYKEGRKSAEEALKIFIKLGNSTWQGVALRTCVKALLRAKKVKEARKLVNRRMDIFKEAKDVVGIAATLDATAEVVMVEGDPSGAAKMLQEAIKLSKDTKMKERQLKKYEATLMAEMANFYLQGQKYDDALDQARKACHLFQKMDCEVEMATTISTMVMSLLCMERPDEALEETNRAIKIYESLNDKKGEGLAWINHCSGLTKMGRFEEAQKIAMRARDIFASQKLLIGEGQALDHLSSLHMTKGDFTKSATCAKRAKQIFSEASCFRQEAFMAWAEAEALFGLAQMQDDHKPGDDLPESFKKACDAAEEALKLAKAVDDDILVMHSQQVVAKTRIMSFRHWEAEEPVQEALEIAQKNSQSMEEASLFLLKAQIHICNGEDDKAQEVAKTARTLFEELGSEQGVEQAREIIDGDYLRQREQEETGVTAATPMPMMPSESQMYGSGGIGGRSGGPMPMGGGAPPPQQMAAAPSAAAPAAPPKGGPTLEQVQESVQDIAMSLIGADELELDTPLMDAGLDSLASVEFQNMLTKEFRGVAMPSTLMFDFPTAKEIASHIKDNYRG